jgi:HlyD family secretion protein
MAGALVVAALWGGAGGLPASRTAWAQVKPAPGATVNALARLEPADGLITVGMRPGQRIERVLVAVGDSVESGQALAVVEGETQARKQLALAEARKTDALRQRDRQRRKVATEREREDQVQKVRNVVLDDTAKALESEDKSLKGEVDALSKAGGAEQSRALAELKAKLDEVRIQEYRAYLEREQSRIDQELLARKRAVEDETLADGGTDDQLLDRQIDVARAALDDLTIKAPAAGTVLDLLAHAGEVSTGPLLALGNLQAMSAVAEVDQADIGSVREGDTASVNVLGTQVSGKVKRIGRLVGRNQLANLDPRAPQDLRVVRVTIALDRAEPSSRFVNLEVEAVITPRGGSR